MNWFVAAVALCVLVPSAHCASGSVGWYLTFCFYLGIILTLVKGCLFS